MSASPGDDYVLSTEKRSRTNASPSTLKKKKKKVAIQDRAHEQEPALESSPDMGEEEDYGEESPGTTQYRGQHQNMDMSYGGEEDSPDRGYNYPKQMTESQGVGVENRLEAIKQNLKN